jgi:membrane-associated protein
MFELISSFGYTGIFLTILGEIGFMLFPLPGDTLLFSAGILVDSGHFSYLPLLLGCFLMSLVGGHVGYYIGTLVDEDILLNNRYYKIKDSHLHKTKEFFTKYGAWAIIFSRYVPVVRSFISQLLGIIHYDKRKFFLYNLIASFIWPFVIITAGLLLGKIFPNVIYYAEYVIAFLFILVSLPLIKEIKNQVAHQIEQRRK